MNAPSNALTVEVVIDGILVQERVTFPVEDEDIEVLVKVKSLVYKSSSSRLSLARAASGDMIDGKDKFDQAVATAASKHRKSEAPPPMTDVTATGSKADAAENYVDNTPLSGPTKVIIRPDFTGYFVPTEGKEFLSRGVQTHGDCEPTGPVPARFEGTMTAPMYFDGMMLTAKHLDEMLGLAESRGRGSSIPVLFTGGMLTSAFKERVNFSPGRGVVNESSEDDDDDDDDDDEELKLEHLQNVNQVRVMFQGRLRDIINPKWCRNGVPVVLDGKITF